MAKPRIGKPIEYRQLCAIVRACLEADLSQDDATWKEAVKVYLARGGWAYPKPDVLERALWAVEAVEVKTRGPRLTGVPSTSRPREVLHQADPPWRGRDRERLIAATRGLLQTLSKRSGT